LLPAGLPVVHKSGEITTIQHDAAIVYANRPFVLVGLVRGLDARRQGRPLRPTITRVLHRASQAARTNDQPRRLAAGAG
jgi:beta-lactamase class A